VKILVIGRRGQLGWELARALPPLGSVICLSRSELDLADAGRIRQTLAEAHPDVVVNAAAYTAVDRAEQEPELARRVNALGPAVLAEAARDCEAALIHFSTDYVFDGGLSRPYQEDDTPNPLSVYGRSKLEGEQQIHRVSSAFLILRTSWVFSLRRPCFVTQVLRWARTQDRLRIAQDQVGSPTWARLLAEATGLLLARLGPNPAQALAGRSGTYHLAASNPASRLEWARQILRLDPNPEEQRLSAEAIEAASSRDFPTPATRPAFSALDSSRFASTFGLSLPSWEAGLRLAMEPHS
jgi:dTDP-4-dehydrorhamnose reductase